MAPRRIEPSQLSSVLPAGGRILVGGCSAESAVFADAVMAAGAALGPMTFTGIFVPGLNRRDYRANPEVVVETFFMTPELARGSNVVFLPLCYDDIARRLATVPIAAALFMVAPPDANGMCSFGPAVDFLADLWPRIPLRIAHINPLLPRTRGHAGIPFDAISVYIERAEPPLGISEGAHDPVASAIGDHVAHFIPDGATIQTGLGSVPGAVLRAVTKRRGLRIHSGLIGDAVLSLDRAGALAPGAAITAGVAIGSPALYEAITSDIFSFQPVSVTHDPRRIAALATMIAINSAMTVDLYGQAYAEYGPKGFQSGPGGATDFARGARLGRGLSIVALASTARSGAVSRIVPAGHGEGPVSLSRTEIDIVVTEHGAADLRGKTHPERAAALVAIAHPDHRTALLHRDRRPRD